MLTQLRAWNAGWMPEPRGFSSRLDESGGARRGAPDTLPATHPCSAIIRCRPLVPDEVGVGLGITTRGALSHVNFAEAKWGLNLDRMDA